MNRVREYFAGSPVRVRAVVVALLALAAPAVPALADVAGSELAVGGLVATLTLLLGESAQRKENAKTAEALEASPETE